jgi:hypothetical protein
MTNYNNTIIYKLINYDYPDLVYVGSTTNFTKRKKDHKENVNNIKRPGYNRKVYTNIREHGGWESWSMVQVCEYSCENKIQARQEEDRQMITLKATLNTKKAYSTYDERLENKREYYSNHKEQAKQYSIDNKEKIRARISVKYDCICGGKYTHRHKVTHLRTPKHINFINQPIEQ